MYFSNIKYTTLAIVDKDDLFNSVYYLIVYLFSFSTFAFTTVSTIFEQPEFLNGSKMFQWLLKVGTIFKFAVISTCNHVDIHFAREKSAPRFNAWLLKYSLIAIYNL
jgi:hypothetical protein